LDAEPNYFMHQINRRNFLKRAALGGAAAALVPVHIGRATTGSDFKLTPAAEIEERVRAARPLLAEKFPRTWPTASARRIMTGTIS
jgi:TAT (twin-arginine translocation) pathway signal sequence